MSRTRTVYSAEFKTRLVLELLKEDKTLTQIASKNNITPKNLQNWKKIFLNNAVVAMEPAKAVQEYKTVITQLEAKVGAYAKKVGQLTVENEWAVGKLKSLDSSYKKELVDKTDSKIISVVKQCKLLNYNRSNLFYVPMVNPIKQDIKNEIVKIFVDIPCYGYIKVHKELLERGYNVCINTVRQYRKQLSLRAVLVVRPPNTSWADKQHPKHSYKIRGLDIVRATDNICIERFWRSAKVEKIYLNEYFKISTLKNDVTDYMEFYNYRRFHQTLNYKKPMNVYLESMKINDVNYNKLDEIVDLIKKMGA